MVVWIFFHKSISQEVVSDRERTSERTTEQSRTYKEKAIIVLVWFYMLLREFCIFDGGDFLCYTSLGRGFLGCLQLPPTIC